MNEYHSDLQLIGETIGITSKQFDIDMITNWTAFSSSMEAVFIN